MEITHHPLFSDLNRPLSNQESDELEKQIKEDGVLEPVVVNQDGILVDGYNRQRITTKLKINCPWIVREFDSLEDAEQWAIRKQLGRRNLSPDDFRKFVGKLYNAKKKAPGRPNKCGQLDQVSDNGDSRATAEEVAEEVGVSEKTVRRAGREVEEYESLCDAGKKLADAGALSKSHVSALAKKPQGEQIPITTRLRKGQMEPDELLSTPDPEPSKGEQFSRQKQVAKQYLEKGMRAVDDLCRIKNQPDHNEAVEEIANALTRLYRWK